MTVQQNTFVCQTIEIRGLDFGLGLPRPAPAVQADVRPAVIVG
eukprot:CAMPEP_0115542502 /NCGR_PEP_ID=MMETSP0271-20121206/91028_1 /TAXON_ID=71861 /ORGANISM="Scrippsiella trochoidea, Strain CCMP3099" /LENGTH=42 /DNA_ID= /DNA_START= /DNA_END= /DNA_ORIENTATION=